MQIVTTVRAIIIHNGKLFVVKNNEKPDYFILPGGGIEPGEMIEDAMKREIFEETGIHPELGRLLVIHEFANKKKDTHRIEFFFSVKNDADFECVDLSQASHGFEISEFQFIAPGDSSVRILPDIAREVAREIIDSGLEQFSTRIVTQS